MSKHLLSICEAIKQNESELETNISEFRLILLDHITFAELKSATL